MFVLNFGCLGLDSLNISVWNQKSKENMAVFVPEAVQAVGHTYRRARNGVRTRPSRLVAPPLFSA